MTTLADCVGGRDNNFNLIRFTAAVAVLVTHSYAVIGLPPSSEPMRYLTGISFGGMAVDAFFITSGFLVTGSLLSRKNALHFLFSRLLRIYPALIVVNVLTVFVLGMWLTTFSRSEYLSSPLVSEYLLKNSTLWFGIAFTLPGLFESNNIKGGVNGVLWTMYFEVRMYAILLLTWLALTILKWSPREEKAGVVLMVIAVVAFVSHIFIHYSGLDETSSRFYFMFFSGVLYYLLRDRIILSNYFFGIALGLLTISTFFKPTFFFAYHFLYAYIILYLAYVPRGVIRTYNRLGDYSYGFYLYAFPIQQMIATFAPDISLIGMIMSASLITLSFAISSWHLLERRALSLKDITTTRVEKWVARFRPIL